MAFTCPACARTSYHPEDARLGYCGSCHAYTGGHFMFTDETGTWCFRECPRPEAECGQLAVLLNQ